MEKVARRKPEKVIRSRTPRTGESRRKPARRKPEKVGECKRRKFGESVLRHSSHQNDWPDFLRGKRRRKPEKAFGESAGESAGDTPRTGGSRGKPARRKHLEKEPEKAMLI